ncbi:hypothetical protein ACQP2Y_21920 [Actinoplanes sp. CA-051413]|uniref:hypothetical protein n=1 Tax=Actinoplanes sp. CA-051413 TaxID=3239899 RepID=UPI003D98EA79
MTAVQKLLWEWLGWLFACGIVLASYAAVYLMGRGHGRQAQRRANVLSAVEEAAAVTVAIPLQRQDVES